VSDVTTSVGPTVMAALQQIAVSLQSTIQSVVPSVTGTVVPLAAGEAETLIASLTDMQSMVSDIDSTLKFTVSGVTSGKRLLSHLFLPPKLS
jgi:hypothetical protein